MNQVLEIASDAGSEGGGSWITLLLPFVVMFVIFYFLLIRPQQKRQKQRNMLLLNLEKGDKVVTIGGIHGTIVELTDDTVVLKVNDSTRLTFDRSAINNASKAKADSSKG
ncbi:preprotein translocase subunit YajC [Marinicrinis lubricantis]|uniref:Preprotein translocase subunit YajC n=1 Tax=Marinicrinis lubricantis TaxID=2086470 RepID=A0ABW1ITT7_9BACL